MKMKTLVKQDIEELIMCSTKVDLHNLQFFQG